MNMGALDFAGGTVVHINSGVSALTIALVLGKRKDISLLPHNLGYAVLGAALLWFGWMGFNGGSSLRCKWSCSKCNYCFKRCSCSFLIVWTRYNCW